jgi:hypothetical protein
MGLEVKFNHPPVTTLCVSSTGENMFVNQELKLEVPR